MNNLRNICALVTLALLMTGCASTGGNWYDDWSNCALAGAAAGGAVGATHEGDAAAAGMVGGAVIGGTLCAIMGREEAEAVVDDDGDGVDNNMDKCPGTPIGTPVDNNGCKLAESFTLDGVNFHHDSARLTDGSLVTLQATAMILARHPELVVEIAGYTDSQGSAEYNLDLSERRANAVRDHLISTGANHKKLTAKGYGEADPIADNGTRKGRALNRRVEFRHN